MADKEIDPTTHRMIQTREGVEAVPRTQTGVPLKEYFQNAELPADLDRAMVYVTAKGPVVARPDPEGWTQEHGERARHYAGRLREMIDEKGYYARTMDVYAGRLSDETGHPRDQMKAVIAEAFQRDHGQDPYSYLQKHRRAHGLPVRDDQPTSKNAPTPSQEG